MERVIQKTKMTFEMIRFSHSIFALPFALASMFVAAQGWPGGETFLLTVTAMVTARSAAMAFNRLIDAEVDAKNPRTKNRHIPRGDLSKKFVFLFTLLSVLLFLLICSRINELALTLSPLAVAWILGYSFTKRFTWLSHLWLGISLGLSPLGAWVAVTGEWPWPALFLGGAVTFWAAGFDIIYATQDVQFDLKEGIHSAVARFGIGRSLWISRVCHLLNVFFLILFGTEHHLGAGYWVALYLIILGLIYEQSMVKPKDLSKVNAAFFTTNGWISILFLAGIFLEFAF